MINIGQLISNIHSAWYPPRPSIDDSASTAPSTTANEYTPCGPGGCGPSEQAPTQEPDEHWEGTGPCHDAAWKQEPEHATEEAVDPRGQEEEAARAEQVPGQGALGSAATRMVPEGFTTLVIRNIPARYTQEKLLAEFGADGSFDLFFLPYSFRDGRTMGYAFINFRTHDFAVQFQQQWHRQFLQDHGRTKHLDVTAATVQGLAANLEQFNGKSVARLQRVGMLPVFLDEAAQRLDPIRELQRYGTIPVPRSGQTN